MKSPDGVRELSVKTGLTPNLTRWYLKNLEPNHVVRKDPGSDKYELGYRLFELGNRKLEVSGAQNRRAADLTRT